MLDLLIKSSVRRKILWLFVLNPAVEIYPGQAAGEIDEHPYAVGLELKSLAEGGILKRIEKGKKVYYQLNESYPFIRELTSITQRMREQGNVELREIPDLEKRAEMERNLQKVLEDLKKYYDPEKVIVFGSAASGKVGPYSDIDLVVVKKTSLPYFARISQLIDLVPYDFAIDFLVYTPEEFDRASKERRFFREEILKKGKVLYEKTA